MKKNSFFEQVYEIVKNIPEGSVMTYGQIAKKLKTRDSRKVGWALHANPYPNVPCHRVVNKDGRVSESFAFDGAKEQKRRLISEGVTFKDEKHIDLPNHVLQG